MVLDYFIAKQKHRMWMINMKAYLLNLEDFDASKVASHTACDLGKWIYSYAITVFAGNADFDELEKIHQELHKTILNIISLKENNNLIEANTEFNKLEKISNRILILIDNIEKANFKFAQ